MILGPWNIRRRIVRVAPKSVNERERFELKVRGIRDWLRMEIYGGKVPRAECQGLDAFPVIQEMERDWEIKHDVHQRG